MKIRLDRVAIGVWSICGVAMVGTAILWSTFGMKSVENFRLYRSLYHGVVIGLLLCVHIPFSFLTGTNSIDKIVESRNSFPEREILSRLLLPLLYSSTTANLLLVFRLLYQILVNCFVPINLKLWFRVADDALMLAFSFFVSFRFLGALKPHTPAPETGTPQAPPELSGLSFFQSENRSKISWNPLSMESKSGADHISINSHMSKRSNFVPAKLGSPLKAIVGYSKNSIEGSKISAQDLPHAVSNTASLKILADQ